MKLREKTKLETIAEIPLEELEGQVRVEGEFIIYGSHSLCSNNIQQIINIISYVENISYHMKHMNRIIRHIMLFMICSKSYATCEMRIFTNSLVLNETEPIILEWFFKTTTVIEPERIEFEMGNILEL